MLSKTRRLFSRSFVNGFAAVILGIGCGVLILRRDTVTDSTDLIEFSSAIAIEKRTSLTADLGVVVNGRKITRSLPLFNNTHFAMEITGFDVNCSCARIEPMECIIPPHRSVPIVVHFEPASVDAASVPHRREYSFTVIPQVGSRTSVGRDVPSLTILAVVDAPWLVSDDPVDFGVVDTTKPTGAVPIGDLSQFTASVFGPNSTQLRLLNFASSPSIVDVSSLGVSPLQLRVQHKALQRGDAHDLLNLQVVPEDGGEPGDVFVKVLYYGL